MAAHAPTASASELAQWIAEDEDLRQAIARDPTALAQLVVPARDTRDRWPYRLVVIALGLTAIFVVVGVFVLKALKGDTVTIPDALVAIGSAAVAGLAGLLAPSPTQ